MASPSDLCSLVAARRWLGTGPNTTTDDDLLAALITAASRTIYATLGRGGSVLPTAVAEVQDGKGTAGITLRRWPVLSVQSLVVEGTTIAATSWPASGVASASGYLLSPWDGEPPGQPQSLQLVGYGFPQNPQNIAIAYTAGYQVTAESAVIAGTDYTLQVQAPWGPWASDVGVTKAGVAMTKVTGTPAVGQYALGAANVPGQYVFAAADVGSTVLITYGFIPQDLAMAAAMTAGEQYRYRDRIGQLSKSLGGQEVASFDLVDLSKHARMLIQPYARVHI